MTKSTVKNLANKLGYDLEVNYSAIYLIKEDMKIFRKSYSLAYNYLYRLEHRR